MVRAAKRSGLLLLRLSVGLALLAWPRGGSAAGTWSVISLPQKPGEVFSPTALAADPTGDLYVADRSNGGQIQRRDVDGNWSVIAVAGGAPGQVRDVSALAVDAAGNLSRGRSENRYSL
jgi:hypothetical protein